MQNLKITQLDSIYGGNRLFVPTLLVWIGAYIILKSYNQKNLYNDAFSKGYKSGYTDGASGARAAH